MAQNQNPQHQEIRENLAAWSEHIAAKDWSHGDPAQAWQHIMDTCLSGPKAGTGTALELTEQLTQAADALIDHIVKDEPWKQAGWTEYRKRSEEWQYHNGHNGYTILKNRPVITFPDTGEELQHEGLIAIPITNSHQLADAGMDMGNALGIYTDRCSARKSLIYTIHRQGNDAIEAAMEAIPHQGLWKLAQLEGPRFRKPAQDHIKIAEMVIATLNGAGEKTSND